MPDGWVVNAEAFLAGVELAIYAGLLAAFVLVVVAAVRRILAV